MYQPNHHNLLNKLKHCSLDRIAMWYNLSCA
jgi:hypothetical protein